VSDDRHLAVTAPDAAPDAVAVSSSGLATTSQDIALAGSITELPIHSSDVLSGLEPGRVVDLESRHGNGDLIRVLDILGIAGPFRTTSPWELQDERGRHLLHAGGYAALPFGENYPPLVEFTRTYLEKAQGMGFAQQSSSEWRAALETNLVALLSAYAPSHHDSQVFFSNSGAEAIEAALKFVRAARPDASVILNFTRAYHGKTFGALSLTPNEEYQGPFKPLQGDVRTLPFGDIDAFEQAVKQIGPKNIAGIFVEPVQGEAGVITPPEGFLRILGEIANRHEIIVVADEIQSGLGRTGHWFASVAAGLEPDIITLAKPLSGGLVPIGATITRKEIVKKLLGGLDAKRHSNTFGGGSMAAAVALRSLELIIEEGLIQKARLNGERGLKRLQEIQQRYPGYLTEVRGSGMLFAMKLKSVVNPKVMPSQKELIHLLGSTLALRELHMHGVHACFTLSHSQIVRLTPALNMPDHLFDEMFDRVERTARANRGSWRMLPKLPLNRMARLARLALAGG
jgi:acetylornithine/succinyldiaminopimelate/putrescine aminotransferase